MQSPFAWEICMLLVLIVHRQRLLSMRTYQLSFLEMTWLCHLHRCCCCVVDHVKSILVLKKKFLRLDNDSVVVSFNTNQVKLPFWSSMNHGLCMGLPAGRLPNIKSWQLLLHIHYGFSPRWQKEPPINSLLRKLEEEKEFSTYTYSDRTYFFPFPRLKPDQSKGCWMWCALHTQQGLCFYICGVTYGCYIR